MQKPIKRYCGEPCYDYHEARNYLEKKYNYKERDYAGRWTNTIEYPNNIPYQNFWHFVLKHNDIKNGSYFTMDTNYMAEQAEEWQKQILSYYRDEFADEEGMIDFYIFW